MGINCFDDSNQKKNYYNQLKYTADESWTGWIDKMVIMEIHNNMEVQLKISQVQQNLYGFNQQRTTFEVFTQRFILGQNSNWNIEILSHQLANRYIFINTFWRKKTQGFCPRLFACGISAQVKGMSIVHWSTNDKFHPKQIEIRQNATS